MTVLHTLSHNIPVNNNPQPCNVSGVLLTGHCVFLGHFSFSVIAWMFYYKETKDVEALIHIKTLSLMCLWFMYQSHTSCRENVIPGINSHKLLGFSTWQLYATLRVPPFPLSALDFWKCPLIPLYIYVSLTNVGQPQTSEKIATFCDFVSFVFLGLFIWIWHNLVISCIIIHRQGI